MSSNLPDGRVEAFVEGDQAAVDRVELKLRRGPDGSHVESFVVEPAEPTQARDRILDPLRSRMEALKAKIRHVPDFPKAGILFYDVTTLLRDAEGLQAGARHAVAPVRRARRSI